MTDKQARLTERWFAFLTMWLLAGMIAHDAGVPWWNGWGPIGDASDIGLCAACAFTFTLRAIASTKE